MYRKTFKLKQHTPIIHFQHDQTGATLRATEVKPKLDRFIIDREAEEAKRKNPQAKREDKPLNYRMQLRVESEPEKILIAAGSLSQEQKEALDQAGIKYMDRTAYFAAEKEISENLFVPTGENRTKTISQGRTKEVDLLRVCDKPFKAVEKWGLFLDENRSVRLIITAADQDTLRRVLNCVDDFFITTNFGTRSTKGFGSFTIIGTDTEERIRNSLTKYYAYRYELDATPKKTSHLGKTKELLEWIQEDHRRLKSGKSFRGYRKAQTFLYGMQNKRYRWDKRYMKGKIVDAINNDENNFHANLRYDRPRRELTDANGGNTPFNLEADHVFVRVLLGLAEQYEFMTNRGHEKYKVKVSHDSIQRYASPIIWKVINERIYLVANEPNNDVRNSVFNFSASYGNPNNSVHLGELSPPTPTTFSMRDFLQFAFDEKRSVNGKDDPNQPIYGYQIF